jgi:hypothetical protein
MAHAAERRRPVRARVLQLLHARDAPPRRRHPDRPAAGGLCVGEAIVGQLYMAIMIARMVGIYANQARE